MSRGSCWCKSWLTPHRGYIGYYFRWYEGDTCSFDYNSYFHALKDPRCVEPQMCRAPAFVSYVFFGGAGGNNDNVSWRCGEPTAESRVCLEVFAKRASSEFWLRTQDLLECAKSTLIAGLVGFSEFCYGPERPYNNPSCPHHQLAY